MKPWHLPQKILPPTPQSQIYCWKRYINRQFHNSPAHLKNVLLFIETRSIFDLGSEKMDMLSKIPVGGIVGEHIMIDRGLVPSESLFVFGRLLKATDNEVGTFRDKFFP